MQPRMQSATQSAAPCAGRGQNPIGTGSIVLTQPVKKQAMTPEQRESYDKSWRETTPQKLHRFRLDQLESYYQFFCSALTWFSEDQWKAKECRERVAQLSLEIQKRQHRESMRVGRATLCLALAAVVVPIVFHILSSKPQPSKTDPENLPASLKTPMATDVSQEQEQSSMTATPSPEQSATLQPSPGSEDEESEDGEPDNP